SAAIVDQLEERGMLNTFLNILAFTRRIEEAWAGIKDVIVPAIGIIVAGFELWLKSMIAVVDFLEEGLGAMGIVFDENMTFWRTLGQVLGVVVIVGTLLATVVMVALASVLLLVAGLAFLTVLPFILLAAGIIGTIYLITRLITFFKWLGTTITEWADSTVKAVSETVAGIFAPFQEFVRRMGIFWSRLTATDAPWRKWVIPWYEKNINKPIIQPLVLGIAFIKTLLSSAWASITSVAVAAWTYLSTAIMAVWTPVISFLSTVLSYIGQIIVAVATPIVNFFLNLGSAIAGFFTSLITSAYEAGAGLVNAIWEGISSGWSWLVKQFSENVAEIRDLLPGSDARTGPLSDLTSSGQSLITTFVGGAQSVIPTLTTTMGEGAQTILGALGLPTTVEGAANTLETGMGLVGQVASPLVDTVGEAVGVGGGARNVTVTVGDITVNVQQASPEEAERLANMIMERIESSIENEGEATFA
ncbi:MAG: phage tail protein, partial [Candidatus Hermodarchaeia archaeon]